MVRWIWSCRLVRDDADHRSAYGDRARLRLYPSQVLQKQVILLRDIPAVSGCLESWYDGSGVAGI